MSDLNAYDFSDEYYSDEDDYPSSYPPQTKDLEVDAEEDVGALADALELNTKLKEIMSSGLDPVSMQEELNRLMSGMQQMDVGPSQNPHSKIHNPPPLANVTQSSMNRGHPNPRKANPKKVNPAAK
ncbi:hypothetical protein TrST_g4237 [Triparma strigata]|uniref:Uncharacterized protein n=1 Tax=Triparma strigata TaxID=1606541 RepID=A0A9W6ZKY5_9STRA|nr:hypothetical protein TrST_g4237 [Triparma strigata]